MERIKKNPEYTLFTRFVKSIPMAICGLALGLAALGNLLQSDLNLSIAARDALRLTCGALAFIVLCVYGLKIVFDFAHAREELKTSVAASVMPTVTMALMLLSVYLKKPLVSSTPIAGLSEVATAIWYAAVAAQIGMMVFFCKRFVLDFKIGAVFPSWFIVFVGIVVASVTAPAMDAIPIGQAAFYIGFAFYFICLVMVLIRLIKVPYKKFLEPARPTMAIFSAPMALLVVGYFNSFTGSINKGFLYFMLALALISYLFVLAMLVPLLLKRFYPSYSAFTFPLVISAIAFRIGAAQLVANVGTSLKWLTTVATVTQWIAAVAVVFVLVMYIKYFIYWAKFSRN